MTTFCDCPFYRWTDGQRDGLDNRYHLALFAELFCSVTFVCCPRRVFLDIRSATQKAAWEQFMLNLRLVLWPRIGRHVCIVVDAIVALLLQTFKAGFSSNHDITE